MLERRGILVESHENKKRLEDFLFDRFKTLSKLYLRELVKTEKCEVNGRFENRGHKLKANDFVEVELEPARRNSMVPEELPLQIVHEDADLIVINKPVGMLVHPSHRDKRGTVLNALSHYLNLDPDCPHIRPGLIHRLDKDTSGLLVVAKNTRTHSKISAQFEKKTVEKVYLAMVEGVVFENDGVVEAPIGRFAEEKIWAVKSDGRNAQTRFRVLQRFEEMTLVELEPVTGRTNQLRIHCAEIGHPIVGDLARGGRHFHRLCLHSARMSFRHPSSSSRVTFEQPVDFGNGPSDRHLISI